MKHAAIAASPAFAFQAVTAFVCDACSDAAAVVQEHSGRQADGKEEQSKLGQLTDHVHRSPPRIGSDTMLRPTAGGVHT